VADERVVLRANNADDVLERSLLHPTFIPELEVSRAVKRWLRPQSTLEEKLCLVVQELSCGSRLVEILLVSLYSDVSEWTPDSWKDPNRKFGTLDETIDIVVERIAKDRMLKGAKRDLLGDETQQEEIVADVSDDGGDIVDRLIARPVLFGIAPQKMLELIGDIRTELNRRYPKYETLNYTDVRDKEWITKQVNKF
jgi:hypothetical protein